MTTGNNLTPSQILNEINSNMPDNTSGFITPAIERQILADISASYGSLTATNTFTANSSFNVGITVGSGVTINASSGVYTWNLPATVGTAGQVLTSQGGSPMTWTTVTGINSANPTATVGLSAVNGTASTFMTSDSAPALNQGISPTWSGLHTFANNLALSGSISGAVTIKAQPAAGTYNFNLPTIAGVAGQVLTSQGGGSNAMTWTNMPFVIVTEYGADPTGVADSTAAISSAVAALPANGGIVFFPSTPTNGFYKTVSGITLGNGSSAGGSTINNIMFMGEGLGGGFNGTFGGGVDPAAKQVRIKYTGTAGGTLLTINGPGIFGLSNLAFDGSGLAATVLQLNHCYFSTFENLSIANFTSIGIRHTAYTNPTNMFIGACANYFRGIRINNQATNGTTGVDMGPSSINGLSLDVARDVWINPEIEMASDAGSTCMIMRGADGINIYDPFFSSPAPSVTGTVSLKFISPSGDNILPADIVIHGAAFTGRTITPTDNSWRPDLNDGLGLFFANYRTGVASNFSIPLPYNSVVGGINGYDNDGKWWGSNFSLGAVSANNGALTLVGSTSGSATISVSSTGTPQYPGTTTNDNAPSGDIGEYFQTTITSNSNTVTISNASPGVITEVAGAPDNYSVVNFTTTGSLPTGLTVGTNYYVGNSSGTTYNVATTAANAISGTFVNTSSAGSGTHTAVHNAILGSGTPLVVGAVNLTAGDWLVWGTGSFTGNASAQVNVVESSINTTVGGMLGPPGGALMRFWFNNGTVFANTNLDVPVSAVRVSISSTTPYYLNSEVTWTTSTVSAFGTIQARRAR